MNKKRVLTEDKKNRMQEGKLFQPLPMGEVAIVSDSRTMAGEGFKFQGTKSAFTLAEVLITIGIIGVVSAITIPGLITAYQKKQVATKVEKFYSTMNQALRLSQTENGDVGGWITLRKNYTYEENLEFLNQYILPYIKYTDVKEGCTQTINAGGTACVTLLNGDMFAIAIDGNGADIAYFAGDKIPTDSNGKLIPYRSPRKVFWFQFNKAITNGGTAINENIIEPYIYDWLGEREQLITGGSFSCSGNGSNSGLYCTKLLQLNGWKFPNDYPW